MKITLLLCLFVAFVAFYGFPVASPSPTSEKQKYNIHDAYILKIDENGDKMLLKDEEDGTIHWRRLETFRIESVAVASKHIKLLAGENPVSFLPAGKILTHLGVDLRRYLIDKKLAVDLRRQESQDPVETETDSFDDEEMDDEFERIAVVHPEYNDPQTYSIIVTAFLIALGAILLSGRQANQPPSDPSRIFQKYNRDHPITPKCAALMLWWVVFGLLLWIGTALYAGVQLWFTE